MSQKFSNTFLSILIVTIISLVVYIIFLKSHLGGESSPVVLNMTENLILGYTTAVSNNTNSTKTFVFDNFHGSKNISDKFSFQYPTNWHNEGQYFSPEKIEYYDLYSVKAPFYFDLIRADIYDQTEFKNQINIDKRKSPDRGGKIDGKDFKRYDLIDYGSYGGESAGRVLIYVGPKISIDSKEYYLVFHWEEKPLTAVVSGSNPAIFEKAVLSLKFTK